MGIRASGDGFLCTVRNRSASQATRSRKRSFRRGHQEHARGPCVMQLRDEQVQFLLRFVRNDRAYRPAEVKLPPRPSPIYVKNRGHERSS